MKSYLLSAIMLSAVTSTAQLGSVKYTRTIKFPDIQIEGLGDFGSLLPKEHSDKHILYFTPDASLSENIKTEKEVEEVEHNGMKMRIENDDEEEKYYTDIKNKKSTEQKDFHGRTFLIKGEVNARKWKMTGNQKKILDKVAMEAIAIAENDTVTAWYTPEIPIATGPTGIAGLPGLVLEATINQMTMIKATEIKLDSSAAKKIKEPTKGKKVTNEEYEKMVVEKQEEMKKQFGGDGNLQIQIIK